MSIPPARMRMYGRSGSHWAIATAPETPSSATVQGPTQHRPTNAANMLKPTAPPPEAMICFRSRIYPSPGKADRSWLRWRQQAQPPQSSGVQFDIGIAQRVSLPRKELRFLKGHTSNVLTALRPGHERLLVFEQIDVVAERLSQIVATSLTVRRDD